MLLAVVQDVAPLAERNEVESVRTLITTMSEGAAPLIGASPPRDHLILARRFARESTMPNLIRRFLTNTSGATAIEYGMIAGLISVVIISAS